jgi:DNA recombination protein RmuC
MTSTLAAVALVAVLGALLGALIATRIVRGSVDAMRDQFAALSVDALDANGDRFLSMATAQLVQPVTAKLHEVDQRIAMFDQERTRSTSQLVGTLNELRTNGEQLRLGTIALTRALRQPQGRGQWGELQLRRVVEMAGLAEHARDFTVQHAARTGDERLVRPDMVVNLPNARCVVIDSKVPLDAFLSAMEAEDDDAAAPHLMRHAEQVRTHVQQLAKRDYSTHLDGALADMVVLFLPAEHLFAAAVQQRPTLVEEAFAAGVVIASPTTLLTLLHVIALGWKEQRLERNAEEIAALGRELHERVATLAEHVGRVGRGLDNATRAYNDAVGSLESRVLVTTRRFEQLDATRMDREVPEVAPLAGATRRFTAPELLDPRDVA